MFVELFPPNISIGIYARSCVYCYRKDNVISPSNEMTASPTQGEQMVPQSPIFDMYEIAPN